MISTIHPPAYPEADPLYPPNEKPRPDGMRQEIVITQQLHVFREYFRDRSDVVMSANNFIYYEQGNPRARVAPDWYVSFGVNPEAIISRESYLVWEVGKVPEFVLEIASRSAWRNDLGWKRDLYAALGVGEYWRFDPTGNRYYPAPLAGNRLVDGAYRPMATETGPDGVISGYSFELDVTICWDNGEFRLRSPHTGEDVLRYDVLRYDVLRYEEERAARLAAEAQRNAIAAENRRLNERLRQLEAYGSE